MHGSSTTSPVVYAVLMAIGCLAAVCFIGMDDASPASLHQEVGLNQEDPLGVDDQASPAQKLAAQESQNHLEHLQSKLQDHQSKLEDEKQVLRQQTREYKRTMQAEQDSLTQYKDRISRQENAVSSLEGKIKTLAWADHEREALSGKPDPVEKDVWGETYKPHARPDINKEAIMPPPSRVGGGQKTTQIVTKQAAGGDVPPQTGVKAEHASDETALDQSIGSAFKSYFEDDSENPTLLQLPATSIQAQVKLAARRAAKAAAIQAQRMGLSPGATAKMVTDAARNAAQHSAAKAEDQDLSEIGAPPAHHMPPAVGTDAHQAALLRAQAAKDAQAQAPAAQAKALKQVIVKDAKQTLKAKQEAHDAKNEVKKLKAKEELVAKERDEAQAKLKKLTKAATAGNKLLGKKFESEMHKNQKKFDAKIQKEHTVVKEKAMAKAKKKEAQKYETKKQAIKLDAAKKVGAANKQAVTAVKKAMHTAMVAQQLAKKEALEAKHAKEFSQTVAKAAQARTEAIKAASAKQMATMEEEKEKAVEHFEKFSDKLKKMESEKETKTSEKMVATAKHADKFLTDAAKAARVAEDKTNQAEFAKSQAAVNEARAAKAVLDSAIKDVNHLDVTVKGKVAMKMEAADMKAAAEAKKEEAHQAILEAKEHAVKIKIQEEAKAQAARHLKRVVKAKAATKETATKHHEAYLRGRADAEKIYNKKLASLKAHSLEKQAKALLKAGVAPAATKDDETQTPETPPKEAETAPAEAETAKAQELVKDAIDEATAEGGDASAAVKTAMAKMAKFHEGKAAAAGN